MDRTVVMVPVSISSVIAPVDEKTAMNKPDRNNVEKANSFRSFTSSSRVYMLMKGASRSIIRAATMITVYTGCRSVSRRVFFVIVSSFINTVLSSSEQFL